MNIICDLDGTIYLGNSPIEGVRAFLRFVKRKSINITFLTNNSSKPTRLAREKIAQLYNVLFDGSCFYGSIENTCDYLEQKKISVYSGVCSPAFRQEAARRGMLFTLPYSEYASAQSEAAVLTYDRSMTYSDVERTYRFVRENPFAPFVATHPDLVCPTEKGDMPDIGFLLAGFRELPIREPKVLGKPSDFMMDSVLKRTGADPSDTYVVGDRLYTDIAMAKRAKCKSVLTLTGETQRSHITPNGVVPDFVVDDLSRLADLLNDNQ